jgi:hypothetical protein
LTRSTTHARCSATDVRWNLGFLYGAIALFLGGSLVTIRALEIGSRALAAVAVGAMVLSAIAFVLSVWLPRRRVDWTRVEAEQRLWESGPLGRSWLRVRRRLDDMWKL